MSSREGRRNLHRRRLQGQPRPRRLGRAAAHGPNEKELVAPDRETTNNRMEMTAVIRALAALNQPCKVTLTTDEICHRRHHQMGLRLAEKGLGQRQKEPVANEDLWREMLLVAKPHKIDWQWVRGHNGHSENERVDKLASDAAQAA
jgi:ribonuclease HI